jgi:hypothetical protein
MPMAFFSYSLFPPKKVYFETVYYQELSESEKLRDLFRQRYRFDGSRDERRRGGGCYEKLQKSLKLLGDIVKMKFYNFNRFQQKKDRNRL